MSLIAYSRAWNIKLPPVGVALFSEMNFSVNVAVGRKL